MSSCKECLHYTNDINQQECRRYPSFILHGPDEWCGEFKRKLPEPDKNAISTPSVAVVMAPIEKKDEVVVPMREKSPKANKPARKPIEKKVKRKAIKLLPAKAKNRQK